MISKKYVYNFWWKILINGRWMAGGPDHMFQHLLTNSKIVIAGIMSNFERKALKCPFVSVDLQQKIIEKKYVCLHNGKLRTDIIVGENVYN